MAPTSPCVCILKMRQQGALRQNCGELREKDRAEKGTSQSREEMAEKGSTPQSLEERAAKLRRAEKENALKKIRARYPRNGKTSHPGADQAGNTAVAVSATATNIKPGTATATNQPGTAILTNFNPRKPGIISSCGIMVVVSIQIAAKAILAGMNVINSQA